MYPGSGPYLRPGSGSLRLGPLFLESFPLMVRPGLAWSHVQPVLENKSGCELRATSYEQTGEDLVCSKLAARSSKLDRIRASGSSANNRACSSGG